MNDLKVGLDAWIIQDGNYSDFRAGQEAKFALAFVGTLAPVHGAGVPTLEPAEGANYSATGRIVFVHPEVWVCDFGILAYQRNPPPAWATEGRCAGGDIYLGVDPFDYFEHLHALSGMPSLQYNFRLARIWLETTPWTGDKFKRRKAGKTSFREVGQTNAWSDDEGVGHYVLECQYLSRG